MRTWGRQWGVISDAVVNPVSDATGSGVFQSGSLPGQQAPFGTQVPVWVEVSTDSNGNNDMVYLTTLCQTLLLNLGESPIYSNVGIPAQQSVMQQAYPDYYVALTQQTFAPYFAALTITRTSGNPPTYAVQVLTHQGVTLNASVPIPV